ncbi:S9 family peptidase [Agromyces protaetiae]|uniref:S9 family peptidase n=1 Tax=Agromyces protaetiae TaxID=2509455 RepID=A0A4P6FBW9_9MICO|nr:prolyl oligopeptidase family serine peptidase [Agromyces protaetiae]QAY73502.1 S9 family peptidase [Agromyces protaetiae]
MAESREVAYGEWPSPITAADVAAAHGSMTWAAQPDGAVWWIQSDPADGGRLALYRAGAPDEAVRLTPLGSNVRNRVHEYGGLPWCAVPGASVPSSFCYTEWTDGRIRLVEGGVARPITPAPDRDGGFRYAELQVVGDEVWALREHHYGDAPTDVVRDYVAIPLDGAAADDPDAVHELGASGHHFLAGLRVSPDGARAAWLGWSHPHMSWGSAELVVADLVDGGFQNPRTLAGGVREGRPDVAVCQLEWDADGTILYLGDENGWWNLRRLDPASGEQTPVLEVEQEIGGALWRPGQRWFAPLGDGRFGVLAADRPGILDPVAGAIEPIAGLDELGLDHWTSTITAHEGRLAAVGHGPAHLPAVVAVETRGEASGRIAVFGTLPALPLIGADASTTLDPEWLPVPEHRWFDAADGVRVPAHVYPPTNPGAHGPAGERPPYVVHIHGGPTGTNGVSLDLEIAYFTSRGVGVVAPEYGGSTGYGRAWRDRLNEQWGVVDLADAETVARGLVAAGEADPGRLVIRGGSAGGFTSARAMTAPSSFAVGLVSYPVIDLIAWMEGENHDLESQYLVSIVGPLPEEVERYRDRSPSEHPAEAHGPVLVLQGLDDRICLAVTTERFVAGLAGSGQPHHYVGYEGEQHGFRKSETVEHAIATEFAFLVRAFELDPVSAEPLGLDEIADVAGLPAVRETRAEAVA